nr:lipid biosynthesis B12-binding/radical SAM protein [Desulfuromonadales bacterium]NIS39469.1 lipid biosynthesis B12-binding/radical SAM protein [Desulfuromonadales bacterium]
MSRVFLISSNTTTEPYPVYPLGMALVAAALVECGHEVRQFDWLVAGQSEQALRCAVEEFSPDVVSLSLRNIDNVDSFSAEDGWYLAEARRLVALFRQVCDKPVVVGGPAFSIMPEAILDYLGADHGVAGEGERALCELVEGLAAGRSMPRLFAG